MEIPDRVRVRPPDYVGKNIRAWYVPANSRRDLPRGSTMRAMDDFLMSNDLQNVLDDIGEDIAMEARAMAIEEGHVETGEYATSFDSEPGPPVVIENTHPNPRRSVRVTNDATYAAAIEFGNAGNGGNGHRILLRAGLKFHTPKGDVA